MAARRSSAGATGGGVVLVSTVIALGLSVWRRTNSAAWAVAASVACAVGLAGVLLFYRSRATSQLQTAVQTGRIDLTAYLDTASLPGTWPVDARRTMGVSRNNAPAMPIQFAMGDTFLHLWKTQLGTHPFTAEIALRDIAGVTAGKPRVMPVGATLHLDLRDGTEVRFHVQLSEADTAELAALMRDRCPTATAAEPAAGIVITSRPP